MMIILLILITLSLDSVWILLGENCYWSLLGLKGLNRLHVLRIMVTISWATKFIIVLREETATKQSETLNNGSKKLEEGINDTAI